MPDVPPSRQVAAISCAAIVANKPYAHNDGVFHVRDQLGTGRVFVVDPPRA